MKNKKIFLIMVAMLFLLPFVSVNAENDEDLFEPFKPFLNYDLNLNQNVKEYNLSVNNDISRIGVYSGIYNSDENLAFADKFPNTIFLNCLFKKVNNMEISPALFSSNIKLNGVEILNSDFSFNDELPLYNLFGDLWLKDVLPFAKYNLNDLDKDCSEEDVCTYSKDGKVMIKEKVNETEDITTIETKYYDENGNESGKLIEKDSETDDIKTIEEIKYYDENGKLRFEKFHNSSNNGAYVYDENENIKALDLIDLTDENHYFDFAGILGNLNVGNNELKIEFGDADDPEHLEFLVNINRKAADSKIDKDLTATPNTGSAFVIAIIIVCLLSIGVGIYYYQKMRKQKSEK